MRRNEIRSLGNIINEYLKSSKMTGKLAEISAVQAWQTVMGPAIFQATRDIKIRNGVLYVQLGSSVIRNELFMRREQIRNRLNEHVGVQVVREIILK